jgi:hypothetical protein
MAKAENIAAAIFGIGVILLVAAFWLGEQHETAWMLALVGMPVATVGLALLVAVGAVSLGRRAFRAAGILPTPIEPAVPAPGWPGWLPDIDGTRHEVWIPSEGPATRVLVDGAWVRTRTGPERQTVFEIAGHPAALVASVEWDTVVKGAPLVLAASLLTGGSTYEPLPMRHQLFVDGRARPITERRVYGRQTASPHRPSGSPSSSRPAPTGPGVPVGAAPPAGRRINLDPPGS